MRTISEQKQILQDLEHLIKKMEIEIETLRNINYRYYLMHGNNVQNGLVSVPDNISFDISGDINGDVICRMIDFDKINLKSNYQIIKKELIRLS